MKTRHWLTLLLFALAVAVLAGVLLRLRGADAAEEEGAPHTAIDSARAAARARTAAAAFANRVAVPVEGSRVRRGTFVLWADAAGRAEPLRRAPLPAEVAGAVAEVSVREGEAVRAGHLLVRLDPTEYELGLRQARAELEQARAEFQDFTLGDDRIEDPTLRAERQRQARIRSGLAGAEARVEAAAHDLARTEIRAPFGGRVADLAVSAGSRVRPGDPLVTVVDLSLVEVDAHVLESDLPAIETGREAVVTFTALPGETFTGRVVTINPVVDPETHMGRVTVRLENPGDRIYPGMHARVRIAGRLFEDRVFVPREAIVERSRRDVVFVFEPDSAGATTGVAKWRYVTTGLESDAFVEIVPSEETEIVASGEIVLTGGHTTLTHEARVQLEPEPEAVEGSEGVTEAGG